MGAMLWRVALVGILVITLIGSIAVVVTEPNAGTILGLLGAVGGVMGTFVTTGLDITAKREPSVSVAPSGEVLTAAPPKVRRISFSAITAAAVIGAIIAGISGLVPNNLGIVSFVCFCTQLLANVITGAAYIFFARRDLVPQAMTAGMNFLGGGIAAVFVGIVALTANTLTDYILVPNPEITSTAEFAAVSALAACILIVPSIIVSGVTSLVVGMIWKDQRAV